MDFWIVCSGRSTGRDNDPGGLGDVPDLQGLGLAQSQHWDSVSGPPYFHHQASFPWHSFRERNYQCPPGALIISLPHVFPHNCG